MHILLLILKIIGIALLVILGLLLVFVLLLFFVPFCYHAEGSFYENKPSAFVRIRYLFPLIHVFVKYQEGELEGKAKLLGFTVYNFFPSEEEVEKKARKKAKKTKNNKKEKKQNRPSGNWKAEQQSEEEIPEKKNAEVALTKEKELKTAPQQEKKKEAVEQEEEKKTLLEKIRYFVRTLKEKILSLIEKLKSIRDKGVEIKEKISYYYEIWQRENTQRAFQTAKKVLYHIWKSIRPRKGLVKFHFGTGDPGSTGQMCGYFGMLYPFIGKYVMIEPDFENKIYEGDFFFKGQITLFVFLRAAWKILFDKDIRELRKILMNS